jgi:peptide/nickel transport system permease protein
LGIVRKHILPNLMTPALVQATLDLGTAIMTVTGLSFLGIGVQPPTADWGVMVNEGRLFVQSGVWWVATFPGLMIFLTTLAFNLLGDSIQLVLNPKTWKA